MLLLKEVAALVLALCWCDAAKILVLPADHHSEVNLFAMAGQAAMEAGHEVWLLTTPRHKATIEAAGLHPILVAPTEKSDGQTMNYKVQEGAMYGQIQMAQMVSMMSTMGTAFCEYVYEIFEDRKLMQDLRDKKFDLIIADAFPIYRCSYMIPYYLDVPYLSILGVPGMWIGGVTGLPSVEPNVIMAITNQMTFTERIINTLGYVIYNTVQHYVFPHIMFPDNSRLNKIFKKDPPPSLEQLHDKSYMWLVNFEPVCFDYPRASAPNYQFISGASAKPSKTLPKEISDFVENAPEGVIVMTFGSIPGFASMPTEMLERFMDAFSRLNQRVIARQKEHKLENIPPNVKLMKWVPQNDILGHHNTKLFITHGGNNGQMEALYHGVPSLVMPVAGDQEYSAKRAVVKGYGKTLNLHTFTSDELYETIQDIISNQSFSDNIQKCSAIVKSLPAPSETVSFWVNHVLKFGGNHLHNPGKDMPLYQLLCIDVLLFFQVLLILICTTAFCCCRYIYRKCCRSNSFSDKPKRD